MITAKIGHPGEGKTATESVNIKNLLDKGINVYTNLHVNDQRENYYYFNTKDYEIIYKLTNGIVIFDEGQFLLDARKWQETPIEFRQLLQKGRHEGLDFHILTQNIMQIDVSARRLIHEAFKVVKIISIKRFNMGFYVVFPIDISGLEKEKIKSVIPSNFYYLDKNDFNYFDSYAFRSKKDVLDRKICTIEECKIVHLIK